MSHTANFHGINGIEITKGPKATRLALSIEDDDRDVEIVLFPVEGFDLGLHQEPQGEDLVPVYVPEISDGFVCETEGCSNAASWRLVNWRYYAPGAPARERWICDACSEKYHRIRPVETAEPHPADKVASARLRRAFAEQLGDAVEALFERLPYGEVDNAKAQRLINLVHSTRYISQLGVSGYVKAHGLLDYCEDTLTMSQYDCIAAALRLPKIWHSEEYTVAQLEQSFGHIMFRFATAS